MSKTTRRNFGVSVMELASVASGLALLVGTQTDAVTEVINAALGLNETANSVMATKNAEAAKFGYSNFWAPQTVEVPDASEVSTNALLAELQAVQQDPGLEAQIPEPNPQ